MTVSTASGDILLLLSQPEASRLLADMLSRGRRVIVAESEAALSNQFALGVVDGPMLNRCWRAIAERKRADSPAFLPFLLVTMPQDVPLFARFLWTAADELIQVPVQTPELLARVDVLLRARDASLRALDPSSTRFRAAFENDLAARWIAAPDGRLLVVNDQFGVLLGLDSAEDARRRTWGDFIPDAAARCAFVEELAAGTPIERAAVELRTQRGVRFTASVSAVPYLYAGATEIHGVVRKQLDVGQRSEAATAAPPAAAPPAASAGPEGSMASVRTVLLCDDQGSVRAMAARILRQNGYAVVEAEDGAAALAALREHGRPLDLILTDVAMYGGDEGELAKRAGELRPGVPVVFMSGHTERDTAEPRTHSGKLLLGKPFRTLELLAAVERALELPRAAGA
jgi:PAS domain S-box-containing protein